MNRPLRIAWGLLAVGAATAVGITTHEAGFVVITFLGSLWLPRILGIAGHRHRGLGFAGCGSAQPRRRATEERFETWHREAHQRNASPAAAVATEATQA